MIVFDNIEIGKPSSTSFDRMNGWNIFQTLPWLNFVAETQNATPIILSIKEEGRLLGYFTGLITSRWGIRILGSPFRGWQSYFMGFNLKPGVSCRDILQALPRFVFKELRCHYIEIIDPYINIKECPKLPYKVEPLNWFVIDLSKSEDELMAAMKRQARNCIRQSIKRGVVIEEATDIDFADDYYDQINDVFSKQSLSPPYSRETIRRLIYFLLPTGNIILLRAKNMEGQCIGTGILLVHNELAIFWGAASWRQYQNLRPNEPLAWYAIRKMKERGAQLLYFGGLNEQFKLKLGCRGVELYRFMKTRNRILNVALELVTSPSTLKYKNWMLNKLQNGGNR